ncbi:MAG: hypothetical protein IJM30_07710 [Thermoguttaceae bacterium]|nr:hypothetical protein [Thermoguttaceae bacterium]
MSVIYLSGELAALEIGNVVVQYKKKSNKRPNIIVDGVEYVWNGTRGEYGRWGRNRRGGAYFTSLRVPMEPERVAQSVGNGADGA